jgi:prepilin-type N-terminal cleavage/methylation domain-containing protein
MKNETGFTLIELLVTIAVVSVLVIALAFQYVGWQGGYNIESEMKQLHTDLMNARGSAMLRNRDHFVTLTATRYSVYDDTNPPPDGNGTLEIATDTRAVQRSLNPQYPIIWSNPADTQIDFTQKGLSRDDKIICANPADASLNADNDCIILTATRINIGKLTTKISDGGACDAANCVTR